MWIQVRTMDGKEIHRVDSLSKLTKVEGLRLRIHEVFGVEPHRQRLFYRGKQVPTGRGGLTAPAAGAGPLERLRDPRPPPPPRLCPPPAGEGSVILLYFSCMKTGYFAAI